MTSSPGPITDSHLRRKAFAYLRQSSLIQLRENIGSTAIQRDLPEILKNWGWPPEQIETIDEDLGVSGAIPGLRRGFPYMLSQIRAGVVGIVAVSDISRLGRNVSEFAAFVDACQAHDVLLAHGEQILSFSDPNGAFVAMILGANATRENQSRAEASKKARRKKAENGWASTPPLKGYVSAPHGQWLKDPDPQVRGTITRIFEMFQQLGTAGAVTRAMRSIGMKMPGKCGGGVWTWREPMRHEIHRMLTAPEYKGAYIYGKEKNDGTTNWRGRRGRVKRPVSEWVVVEDHHEPYVAPQVFDQIQARLRSNRRQLRIPSGRGEALIQGLLKCTVHQRSLLTAYQYREAQPDGSIKRMGAYRCLESARTGFSASCCSVLAKVVDIYIKRAILDQLTPPSLASLEQAVREARREYELLVQAREAEIRRTDQVVSEVERLLDQVDPSRVLVHKRLADRLEAALQRQKALEVEHKLHPIHPPLVLRDEERDELRCLLSDLPSLWDSPHVTSQQRKAVVRTAIQAVYLTPRVHIWDFEILWVGGVRTKFSLYTLKGIRNEVQRGKDGGLTVPEIVDYLREKGVLRRKGAANGAEYSEHDVEEVLRGIRRSATAARRKARRGGICDRRWNNRARS